MKPLIRRWLFALAVALLAGCATHPVKTRAPASVSQAEALYQSEDYAAAAGMYQQLAASAKARQKQADLLLHAGDAWARSGQPGKALQALDAIPSGALNDQDRARRLLLSAKLDIAIHQPRAALDTLEPLTGTEQPDDTLSAIQKLRGQALFALDQPAAAVQALVKRAELLDNEDAREANRQLIWNGITQVPESLADITPPANADPAVAGWLALGAIGRTAWQAPYRFSKRITHWRKQYPQHPANGAFINKLLQAHAQRITYPAEVALLLPLEGRLSELAAAVRDGVLAARYAHGSREAEATKAPRIRVYDTQGTTDGTISAYEQAVADGAKVVVGPLRQTSLKGLVSSDAIKVPTLSLSNLPAKAPAGGLDDDFSNFLSFSAQSDASNPDLYQFGFEPEDEARQAAERVVREDRMRGIVLAPATAYGQRMTAAFSKRLQALGGTLLKSETYKPGESQASRPIKQMLNLTLSHARAATLESVLGQNVSFSPRRRQDVQFIFLVADHGQARLIRPQIRYHHGIGIPIYATSSVYQPGAQSEFDLNGVLFPDIPWLLSDDPSIKSVRKSLRHLWPRRFDAASRFFALGYDAYRLVPLIVHLDSPLATPARGVTGLLTMDSDQRIHRQYDWATYQHGRAQALTRPRAAKQ
jgi:outer membrane PBP1 activator LpoA protein